MKCLYCESDLITSETEVLKENEFNEDYSEVTLIDCSKCYAYFEAYKKREK
jgi:hypothetical protein